jgi:hypothetical protein
MLPLDADRLGPGIFRSSTDLRSRDVALSATCLDPRDKPEDDAKRVVCTINCRYEKLKQRGLHPLGVILGHRAEDLSPLHPLDLNGFKSHRRERLKSVNSSKAIATARFNKNTLRASV